MNLLTKEQLEKLTTPRLLAYKNKLMRVPESPNWDEPSYQLNKTDARWQETCAAVKAVLETREHVEKK
jgi:hypothetical protein